MNTKIFKIEEENIDQDMINEASSIIKDGNLVAFPTETVYGLGADGLNENACKKIYDAKGRPSDNPLILHISSLDMLYNLVEEVSDQVKKLIDKFWPGPLTIIFKKSNIIPGIITAGLDTVAIRMPKNKIARALIDNTNTPIAAPSANKSGRPSPTKASHVVNDLKGIIPLIIDGGSSIIGIESTVIDMSSDKPTILRPGYFTYEDIKDVLGDVVMDEALVDNQKIPKSPGQKYEHYSPKADMEVYVGEDADLYMVDTLYDRKDFTKIGIITFDDSLDLFEGYKTLSFGPRDDLNSMSHNLFDHLRHMDELGVDLIIAEGVKEEGLGKSIMNRMRKSAAGNVFDIKEII